MQNRYVGDVADFGKHGLLRFLSGMTSDDDLDRLSLGLVWYLHHDERHSADRKVINRDGRHTGYLELTEANIKQFGGCDRDLWDKLGHLVGRDARCVHCAEIAGLLPDGTKFYDAQLVYIERMLPDMKASIRQHWFDNALRSTEDTDLVCCDPDNGIGAETQMHRVRGPKFVYMADLWAFWERQQSLVVYHHIGRNGSAEQQARQVADMVESQLKVTPTSLLFHRGSARVFYVLPQPRHAQLIEERVGRMLAGPWSRHFERVQ